MTADVYLGGIGIYCACKGGENVVGESLITLKDNDVIERFACASSTPVHRITTIVPLQTWNSVCSPRNQALCSTRGGPVRLYIALPWPLTSTSTGMGHRGGLLKVSRGWGKCRIAPTQLNVSIRWSLTALSKYYWVEIFHPIWAKETIRSGYETDARGLAFSYARNFKDLREAARNGCLTAVN